MSDVFVSYSHLNQKAATRLAESLEREGFSVWRDLAIRPGEVFDKATERALEQSKVVLVLWSEASVESVWVRSEATTALRTGKLLPVMIETCIRPIQFELVRTIDLSAWRGSKANPDWLTLVEAIRGRLGIAECRADNESEDPVAVPVSDPRPPTSGKGHLRLMPVMVTILILGAGFVWLTGWRESPETVQQTPIANVIPLAVLPFDNLSPDPEQEYFSDGLSEEILNQLAQIRGLRVIGRTSSFSFKGQDVDLREIAQKLGVANLLQGSLRKEGNMLRISAQLVDGADGSYVFSRTYDRELSQIFTIQEEVARDVASALSVALDVGEMSRVEGGTNNLEAFDRYQRGRDAFLRRGGVEGFRTAEQLLREAVAIDPQFTRAWLQLAWLVQSPRAPQRPARETEALLQEASVRVTELASDRWEANVIRTYALLYQRNWLEADALSTATYLESPLTAASLEKASIYGQIRSATGRFTDTIDMYRLALQLEPASLVISGDQQGNYMAAGRFAEAEAEYHRTTDLVGDHAAMHFFELLRLFAADEIDTDAVHQTMRLIYGEEPNWRAITRELVAVADDSEAALAVVRRGFESGDMAIGTVYRLADALGDGDLALAALEEILKGDKPALSIVWQASFSDLRTKPRFKQILVQLGIADFFRESGQWGDFCRPLGAEDFECR